MEQTQDLDLASLSFENLLDLKKTLDAEIQSRQTQELRSLKEKVLAATSTLGISVQDLFGLSQRPQQRRGRMKGQPLPAKYKGPNGELWSGKGPSPKWISDSGKDKSEFLIQ